MLETANHKDNLIDATGEKILSVVHSAFYSAAQEPVNGLFQLCDQTFKTKIVENTQLISKPKDAQFNTAEWYAQQAGNAVGMAFDFWALNKLHACASSVGRAESVAVTGGAIVKRAAIDGAIYNGIFHPVDKPNENFYTTRLANAATGAATFATLSGSVVGVKAFGAAGEGAISKVFTHDAVAGLIASAPAGFVNAEAGSILSGNGPASAPEIGKSMYGFAIGGTILGAMHTFAKPVDPTISRVPREVSNPELLNAIRDTANSKVQGGPGEPNIGAPGDAGRPLNKPRTGRANSAATDNLSGLTGAAAAGAAAADLGGRTAPHEADGLADRTSSDSVPVSPDVSTLYDQRNYRWVPSRQLAIDIRTAAGPTIINSTDGVSRIAGDPSGKINHIRFANDATETEKSNLLLAAGYARLAETDPLAYDAAKRATLTGRMGLTSKQSIINEAIRGSQDHVSGGSDHPYAKYLNDRFGPLTSDQATWAQHILMDPTSTESGFNSAVRPATETLLAAGEPITIANRAAAANPAVLRMPAWQRGSAIRGLSAYANALADQMSGPETHPMVRDALVGRLAPNVSATEVAAAAAIVAENPNGLTADVVKATAHLVENGHFADATHAYRALRATAAAISEANQTVLGMPAWPRPVPGVAEPVSLDHGDITGSGALQTDPLIGRIAPDMTPEQVRGAAANLDQSLIVHQSEQVVHDLKSAGLSDDQLQDPRIVRLALDVYGQNVNQLPDLVDTLRVMGPNDASVADVRAVAAMKEAGWEPNNLNRANIATGRAILESAGMNPSPNFVRQLRLDPRFTPGKTELKPAGIDSSEDAGAPGQADVDQTRLSVQSSKLADDRLARSGYGDEISDPWTAMDLLRKASEIVEMMRNAGFSDEQIEQPEFLKQELPKIFEKQKGFVPGEIDDEKLLKLASALSNVADLQQMDIEYGAGRQFRLDAAAAGFTPEQLSDARIERLLTQVYDVQKPGIMQNAAIAVNALGADATPASVNAVRELMAHGMRTDQIGTAQLQAAMALQEIGAPPMPRTVQRLLTDPNFSPGANAQISTLLRQQYTDHAYQQLVDSLLDKGFH